MSGARAALAVLLTGVVSFGAAPLAHAAFGGAASATSSFATAVVAPPTSLTATRSCSADLLGNVVGVQVDAAWTPSATTWVTGQRAELRSGSGTLIDAADLGPTATSARLDVGLLSLSTSYTVVVRATYGSWSASTTLAVAGC